jgi:hypothetical protein
MEAASKTGGLLVGAALLSGVATRIMRNKPMHE